MNKPVVTYNNLLNMKLISLLSFIIVLFFSTTLAFGQCETYLQKAETLFAQKKYEDAKRQYSNYKECKPNATGIDTKISECDRLLKENTNTQVNGNSDNRVYQSTSDRIYGREGTELPSSPQSSDKIPDVEIIKKCIIGKEIQDRHGGYFEQRVWGLVPWTWTIKPNEIKSVEIMQSEEKGNAFICDVRLLLQTKACPTQYVFDLQTVFVLNESNQWIVDNIETEDIYLVKTDRYDHCITIETVESTVILLNPTNNKKSYDFLNFTNNCNVALVVCGQALIDGKWIKFYTYVGANENKKSFYLGNYTEYKIDFIEQYKGN